VYPLNFIKTTAAPAPHLARASGQIFFHHLNRHLNTCTPYS